MFVRLCIIIHDTHNQIQLMNLKLLNSCYFFRECDIDFYYAISPGLDITYSNAKEIACLKRKLDQVGTFTDITAFICGFYKIYARSILFASVYTV